MKRKTKQGNWLIESFYNYNNKLESSTATLAMPDGVTIVATKWYDTANFGLEIRAIKHNVKIILIRYTPETLKEFEEVSKQYLDAFENLHNISLSLYKEVK